MMTRGERLLFGVLLLGFVLSLALQVAVARGFIG